MPFNLGVDNWRLWALLLFVGALALRLITLGSDNIWADEAFSWIAGRLPFSEIGNYETKHPWGYYFLLGRLISVAGDSPWVLRLPSVLFSSGTVAVVFILFRRIADPMTATIAAALLATAAFSISWAQEARMYSMLLFFTWLSALALFRLISTRSRLWLVIYIASAAALTYTHYTGLLILGAHAIYWAYIVSTRRAYRRALMTTAVIAGVAVLALFAPQFAHFFHAVERGGGVHITAPGVVDVVDAAGSLLGIRLEVALQDRLLGSPQFVGLLTGFAAVIALVGARRLWRSDRDSAVFFILMAAMPFFYAVQSQVITPTFASKILLPFLPAWLFLITWGAVGIARSAFRMLEAVLKTGNHRLRLTGFGIISLVLAPLVISNAVVLADNYQHDYQRDWRAVSAGLQKLDPDLILVTQFGEYNSLQYAYRGPAQVKRVGPNNVDAHLGPVGTRLAVVVDRKWDRSMRVRQRVDQFRDILTIEVFHRREYVVIYGEAKYELENVSVWPLKPVNPLQERWTTTQDGYLMAKQNAEFETEIPEGRAFTVEVIFGPESSEMEVSKLIQVIPPGKGHRGFLSDATGLGIRYSEMGGTLAFCMPNDTLARPTFVVLQGAVVESIRSFEGCSLE